MNRAATVPVFNFRTVVHHAGGSYDMAFRLCLPVFKAERIIAFAHQAMKDSIGVKPDSPIVAVDAMPASVKKFAAWNDLAINPLSFGMTQYSGPRALQAFVKYFGELTQGPGEVSLVDGTVSKTPSAFIQKYSILKGTVLPGLGAPLKPVPAQLAQYHAAPFDFFMSKLIDIERRGGIEKMAPGR